MERGYAATTLDDIAALLGNTKGQIYHYYRSKLDLYFDVAVGALYMLNESFGEPVEGDGTRAINWLRQAVPAISMDTMQNSPFPRVALEAPKSQMIGRSSVAPARAQERQSMLKKQWQVSRGRQIQD